MSRTLLADAFAHHVWATLTLLDACLALSLGQMDTAVPGTYGSIIETMRHLVMGDAWYLFALTGDRTHAIQGDDLDLPGLRLVVERHDAAWSQILAQGLDPDSPNVTRHDDGAETRTTVGIRLAQALHHGSDHRSQICTALTNLGFEPPAIDVWAFGELDGRVVELPPPAP